ncbi:MAG TPA: MFS transporter, partial [Thermoanaerobaculia bacterium]|nr:MFS transporter [Thermoanaerobaculia bacterium]
MEPAQASAATVVEPQAARKGMASFGVMWLGQFISLVGSRFTNFAFGLWIYEQTNSATAFSTLIFVSGLPGILLAPVAGALVDRWDRRKVMLGANVLNALASLTMVLILIARGGKLEWWYVYVYSAVGGLLQAFLWPAYMASTTLLMPKKHLARASGLVWLGMSFAGVLAPLPAPWLLETAGVAGIIWIDFATFLFAALSLVFVSIPAPQREAAAEAGADAAPKPAKPSLQGDIREGWAFIRARPGLFSLLLYFA